MLLEVEDLADEFFLFEQQSMITNIAGSVIDHITIAVITSANLTGCNEK